MYLLITFEVCINYQIMDIGANIKKIREGLKMAQKEVALALNVAPTQYSRIENGKVVPSLNSLIAIAKVFNVSLDALVFGEVDPLKEVDVKDKSLLDKVQMIENLPADEKNLVLKVIELAVTKQNFNEFFQKQLAIK